MTEKLHPIKWLNEEKCCLVIDQRLLPHERKESKVKTYVEMAEAISNMVLRGAPLIGIAAAYGMALAAQEGVNLDKADKILRQTRPTAVNLMWALDEIKTLYQNKTEEQKLYEKILEKAHWIFQDDFERCKNIGKVGAKYIQESVKKNQLTNKYRIITHCNAGALATAGYGTALGVIRELHKHDLVEMVYANETRPRQQGARLTAWELHQDDIPVTVVADTMAAHMMQNKMIDFAVVGADRITSNGDAANKIGTLQLAIAANYFQVPFFVAAPHSTIDLNLRDGAQIPIEERDWSEVAVINGQSCTPEGIGYFNPAFDVTSQKLISAIFTECGLFDK